MSLPLVEIQFPSGVAMGGSSIKVGDHELADFVQRLSIEVKAGELVIVKLEIPCRLKMKMPAGLEIFLKEEPEAEPYDDLLPVSAMFTESDGRTRNELLDRHNDVIATFDPTIEPTEVGKLVKLINRHQRGGYAASQQD